MWGCPVVEAKHRCGAKEFLEWIAYQNLEGPFGEYRADLRAGIIASTIANCNRGKGQRAFKPSDFMPKFGERKTQRQSPQQMFNMLFAAGKGMNRANKKKRLNG